ncbi:hypothetical protein DL764_010339 [Monosporascus ibericus]|uniref:Amine oxidase domain-containing protein n=1 Tax=Monosporascus ibericus TaxID=155417 RepID=A0A4Q4SVH7_9PEZI|nr:hypothetical protein DL764_010339 [Monosporascus ibericus]
MLVPGLWVFPEGADIPESLLMNFGEFATPHGIEAALPTIFISTGLGVGNSPTGSRWTASSRRRAGTRDIYDAIATLLGDDDVLYSTTVVSSERDEDGVTVTVRNREDGSPTTIHAARLLTAIPPFVDLLGPFDFDWQEEAVFSQWSTRTSTPWS